MSIQKLTTPKGTLEWVTIDGEGKENLSGKKQYVANIVLEADSPVVEKIKQFWKDNKPNGFKKDAKSLGIYPHTADSGKKDEEGKAIYEEDGKVYLAFKTGVSFPDGSTKVVTTYNSKAAKVTLPEGTKIGNGSIGCLSGAMGIYTNKAPKGGAILDAGVTLYLDAIQILKLEEYTADVGFEVDEDEDGFTGDEGWTGEESSESNDKPKL